MQLHSGGWVQGRPAGDGLRACGGSRQCITWGVLQLHAGGWVQGRRADDGLVACAGWRQSITWGVLHRVVTAFYSRYSASYYSDNSMYC